MRFTKMQGAGNDFIVIDNMHLNIVLSEQAIKALCTPHFGIGADGLILVEPSKDCDLRMNYFNKDGSIAEMCGNGVRCLGKYAVDNNLLGGLKTFNLETRAGKKRVWVLESGKEGSSIRVDMGKVSFSTMDIPVKSDLPELMHEKIFYNNTELTYGCASMGNPHMVILTPKLQDFPIEKVGPYFEEHPMFPKKCNISFAEVIDRHHICMDTWERGVGQTLACGTGTCASVAVLNRMGLVNGSVCVRVSGGNLRIELEDEAIFMTGPAKMVFVGEVETFL